MRSSPIPVDLRSGSRWRHPCRVVAIGVFVWMTVLVLVLGLPARVARLVGLLPPKKGPPFTVSLETTLITEPLDADGWPDYRAALSAKLRGGVPPENNFVVVLRRTGLMDDEPGIFDWSNVIDKNEIDAALGVTDSGRSKPVFRKYHEMFPGSDSEVLIRSVDEVTSRFWHEDEFPEFATWLRSNEPILDLLASSVRRMDCGFVAGAYFGSSARELCRHFCARSFRIDPSRTLREQMSDLVTVLWLGRRASQQYRHTTTILCTSFETLVRQRLVNHLTRSELNESDVDWLIGELHQLPPIVSICEAVELGDQYAVLDEIATLARTRNAEESDVVIPRDAQVPVARCLCWDRVDWDAAFKEIRAAFDEMQRIRAIPDRAVRLTAIEEYDRKQKTRQKKWSNRWRLNLAPFVGTSGANAQLIAMSCLFPYGVSEAEVEMLVRSGLRDQLFQLALELRRFHLRVGVYPESLEELDLVATQSELTDPFLKSGRLVYRRTEPGCIVYSVGPNGRDEDGESLHTNPTSTADDIAVRLVNPGR